MPLLDPAPLWRALQTGAVVSTSTTAKQVTKSAYNALKAKAGEVWGQPALQAFAQMESKPSSKGARAALCAAIPFVSDSDAPELTAALKVWADALKQDKTACDEINHAQVHLDLKIGANAIIGELLNLTSLNIKADTRGNFELGKVTIADRGFSGNF